MVRVKDPIPGVVYMSDADIGHYVSQGVFTNQTLIGAYRETFSRHAGRIALSGPTRTMSYAEFDALTTRGAAALWRLGLRPSDRALFQIRNSPELVQAFFSCLKIGVIPICTLQSHREQEITYIGNHAAAKVHFVHGDDSRFDMVSFARSITTAIPSVNSVIKVLGGPAESAECQRRDGIDLRWIEIERALREDGCRVEKLRASGIGHSRECLTRKSEGIRVIRISLIGALEVTQRPLVFPIGRRPVLFVDALATYHRGERSGIARRASSHRRALSRGHHDIHRLGNSRRDTCLNGEWVRRRHDLGLTCPARRTV